MGWGWLGMCFAWQASLPDGLQRFPNVDQRIKPKNQPHLGNCSMTMPYRNSYPPDMTSGLKEEITIVGAG